MNGAGLVYVIARNLRIFDNFNNRGLARLFVVFDGLGYS